MNSFHFRFLSNLRDFWQPRIGREWSIWFSQNDWGLTNRRTVCTVQSGCAQNNPVQEKREIPSMTHSLNTHRLWVKVIMTIQYYLLQNSICKLIVWHGGTWRWLRQCRFGRCTGSDQSQWKNKEKGMEEHDERVTVVNFSGLRWYRVTLGFSRLLCTNPSECRRWQLTLRWITKVNFHKCWEPWSWRWWQLILSERLIYKQVSPTQRYDID